jgi:hypothetical protein
MVREFAELFGYTTPPAQEFVCSTGLCHYKPAAQRPWVGLTEKEVSRLWSDAHNDTSDRMAFQVFAAYIDAELKEKNT